MFIFQPPIHSFCLAEKRRAAHLSKVNRSVSARAFSSPPPSTTSAATTGFDDEPFVIEPPSSVSSNSVKETNESTTSSPNRSHSSTPTSEIETDKLGTSAVQAKQILFGDFQSAENVEKERVIVRLDKSLLTAALKEWQQKHSIDVNAWHDLVLALQTAELTKTQ